MDAILQGSLVVVFIWLLVGGLGVPLPEDLAVISAGVLVERGAVSLPVALAVVFTGVLCGDALLFFLARRLGANWSLLRRILPPERRTRIEAAYRRYGGRMVFFARNLAGLRGAVFAMAGILRMAPQRFLLWDAAAACVSVPLTFALGYFGSRHIDRVRAGIARVEHWVLLFALIAAVVYLAWWHVRKIRSASETPATA